MTGIPAPAQLLALAVLLYAYDASQLLFAREGIITPQGKGWMVSVCRNGLLLLGKTLFIPNLLLPHRPLCRLTWNPEKIEPIDPAGHASRRLKREFFVWRRSYWVFIPVVYGMGLMLFVITPYVFYRIHTDRALLTCLALIYFFSLQAGLLLAANKKHLRISGKKAAALFFECLLCPPFAINLIRKLSLLNPPRANFVTAAFVLLDETRWPAAQDEILARIDQESQETDAAQTLARLAEARRVVEGMREGSNPPSKS